ncbi:MAG: M20/M25/M40 family metallo-hydrolase, partial [Pseudomonadota bacterium]|nr:M20/M25/M40 family metallo-hydrolase [Pseudomonadota bacterium]
GNDYFSATSFQISNIHAGTGANNVIPGAVEIDFNFRFSPSSTPESLQLKTESILKKNNLSYSLEWTLSGRSFLTHEGYLTKTVKTAIQKITGIEPQLSTTGGTSDGRFIVDICSELVEFGPINASIHKINEHIDILDLERLTNIYTLILKMLLEE